MLRKAELRKLTIQFCHDTVTCHFRDDAGSGDREGNSISFHNPIMRMREIPDRQAIYQAEVGWLVEAFHRPAHRQMSGSENIESVDFFMIGNRDRPVDLWMVGKLLE
jgi:hypothetical protein